MKNQYVELVRRWLNDIDSVSYRELRDNAAAARTCAFKSNSNIKYIASNVASTAFSAITESFDLDSGRRLCEFWIEKYDNFAGKDEQHVAITPEQIATLNKLGFICEGFIATKDNKIELITVNQNGSIEYKGLPGNIALVTIAESKEKFHLGHIVELNPSEPEEGA